MKTSLCLIIFLLVAGLPFAQTQEAFDPGKPLPADTSRLWVADGNLQSDTVLLICQGGPSDRLTIEESGRTSYRYIPKYAQYTIAYVHQAQTWDPDLMYRDLPSPNRAKAAVEQTTEILVRSIRYFKERGKTVMVIGTSYGAYIGMHALATRENLADRYVLIAGRVDDPADAVDHHLQGYNGAYSVDGRTFIPQPADTKTTSAYQFRQMLKGAIGQPRYSRLLAGADLSNLWFFYAANDERVGRLTEEEVGLLENRGAQVFATSDGHTETLYRFIDRLMAKELYW